MTKKERDRKKELARLYYMQGEQQNAIAVRVGVSAVTIGKWVKDGGWELRRSAMNVTRPEIVNRNLQVINKILDRLYESEDVGLGDMSRLVDQISKLAAAIDRLDKKANVVDTIEVFTGLNRWMEARMEWDREVTPELLQTINRYQDLYINEMVNRQDGRQK